MARNVCREQWKWVLKQYCKTEQHVYKFLTVPHQNGWQSETITPRLCQRERDQNQESVKDVQLRNRIAASNMTHWISWTCGCHLVKSWVTKLFTAVDYASLCEKKTYLKFMLNETYMFQVKEASQYDLIATCCATRQ